MRISATQRVGLSGGPARWRIGFPAAVLGLACSSAPAGPPPPPPTGGLAAEVVASGLDRPLLLVTPPGDPRRFVVEQTGAIRILGGDGTPLGTPFLDLAGRIAGGGERGLLGLAFHPDYRTNGHLYVNYTDTSGNTVVERYTVSADPDVADPGSAVRILAVTQPFANHNGGQLAFGPDGMLYVFMGDGGGEGDPFETGQDPGDLLGSILRLDVDGGDPYGIPPDNPFVGVARARPEVWAIGLRNPWRSWFDVADGSLYVADVGQSQREEVSVVSMSAGGLNYGWNILEGTTCFARQGCDPTGTIPPVLEYTHADGCAITGGVVYRGSLLPELVGHYFYSDFCSGFLRSFRVSGGMATDGRQWSVGNLGSVTSFGVDADDELYVTSAEGRLFRIVPAE